MTPRFIGRYAIERELGSGSFGKVYLAEGEVPGKGPSGPRRRRVAIKVLRDPGDAEALETVLQEFELLDQVKHRTICRAWELLDDPVAVVMDYVHGLTLREVMDACRDASFPVLTEAAVEIGIEVADCLYQAWATPGRNGEPLHLVHRDLKPENVMLTPEGEVKVLDFGLARVAAEGARDESVMGTPLYMAPEQALGRDVDHRTDLFAVGLILFELLMDRPAYQVPKSGPDPVAAVMRRIERADLAREVRDLEGRLPGPGPVVARCLQANPRARYDDGHELMLDLRRQLVKDRGAYLTEFCDLFFNQIRPLTASPEAPAPGAAGGGKGRGPARVPPHEQRRSEPMAKKNPPPRPNGAPPRPGGGPPRPGPRPRSSPPAGGPPRPGPAAGPPGGRPPARPGPPSGPPPGRPSGPPPGRPPTPPRQAAPTEEDDQAARRLLSDSSARSPDETGMLQMVPLDGDAEGADETKAKSATQFFAIPAAKKKPQDPAGGAAGAIGAAGGAAALGASAGHGIAGPSGSLPPAQSPGMAPPGPGGGPMAISGPVASGPTAGGGGAAASPFQVAQQPSVDEGGGGRARSFRVYAIILGLFGLMGIAMTTAIVAVVIGMNSTGEADAEEEAVAEAPEPEPSRKAVDTAEDLEPIAAPPPPPKPVYRPRPSSAAPAPAPRAAKAPASFVVPDERRYLTVEVTCPGGFRQRGAFSGNKATVQDVPTGEECEAHFKGGAPARARPVHGGKTWNCEFPSATAVCK